MEILVEQIQDQALVTVMKLVGELDASCYRDLIDRVQHAYQIGTRRLLLDMSALTFMSSAGLVALHSAALLMRGEALSDQEGWGAFHAVSSFVETSAGFEANLKLLNPSDRVKKTLQQTGFERIFSVFDDRKAALASFQ
jgi:anti-anti-sigma regulatory factor